MTLDTLSINRRLLAKGFKEDQAEVLTEVLQESLEGEMATKADIKILEEKIESAQYKTVLQTVTILGVLTALLEFLIR